MVLGMTEEAFMPTNMCQRSTHLVPYPNEQPAVPANIIRRDTDRRTETAALC